jgi:excisionase family DNA binding protein
MRIAADKPKRRAQLERGEPCPRLLYRRDEAAAMLGVSASTLYRLEHSGQLTRHTLGSKQNSVVVYRASDLLRLAGVTPDDATVGEG